MSDEHARIEELLAGYALDGLAGEDAADAEALLEHHVPGCLTCRSTLRAFGAIRGDLGLVADPMSPPDTLLPRLHRELEPRARRRNPARLAAVAASIVLVVGLGGLGLTRLDGDGATLTQLSAADIGQALELAGREGATMNDIGPATEVSAPGMDHFYVYGETVPAPPPGEVYRMWLVRGEEFRYVGDFLPAPDGAVVLRVDADPDDWDRVVVTTETAGSAPTSPGATAWDAAA
ncbi:MAG TPA: anti-sigma factor [Actinomycetota bacterium]|nr:anti-sigma factor [Actinomycetota bacterium]